MEFPWDVTCEYATYETQFGLVRRPTHYNTSWDMARFEVCGHKFVDLSEVGSGVALLNDCKYGMSVHDGLMRLSLVRSPKAPDAHCDIGRHTFRYGVLPHCGNLEASGVVQAGYAFNIPLLVQPCVAPCALESFFRIEYSAAENFTTQPHLQKSHLILDTIKPSETEGSSEVILRLYESVGSRGRAFISWYH